MYFLRVHASDDRGEDTWINAHDISSISPRWLAPDTRSDVVKGSIVRMRSGPVHKLTESVQEIADLIRQAGVDEAIGRSGESVT